MSTFYRSIKLKQKNPFGGNYFFFPEINSTNTYIKENLSLFDDGDLIWSHHQSSGRGRSGRSWKSNDNGNLYFTLLIKGKPWDEKARNISQTIATGLCLTLQKYISATRIKWPNDLLIGNSKIAGILTEAIPNKEKVDILVGVGVNLRSDHHFLKDIDREATSLFDQLTNRWIPTPSRFLSQFCSFTGSLLADLMGTDGFSTIFPIWKNNCLPPGTEIYYHSRPEGNYGLKTSATIIDYLPSGEIVLESGGQQKVISSGELTL